ncbi:MAG: hypothetical protein ACK6AD_15055 [Cyanobacteriota bacterium]|jgi:uncharacterized protein (DUF697 family)
MATKSQEDKAKIVIHTATVAAATASAALAQGALFGADTPVLTAIHIGMVHSLGEIFGQDINKQAAIALLGVAAGAGIGLAGARAVLGLIPWLGNAANAAISAGYTETLGWWCFGYFDDQAHGKLPA